jgi:hypothetical protein
MGVSHPQKLFLKNKTNKMAKNLFNSIKLQRPKKNVFDLTHDVKLSADMGNLTPILTLECVPGDKFEIGCESLIRFAPMIAPVMHRMDVSMHYFFVPNRILWENWEKFITGNDTELVAPYMPIGSLWAETPALQPLLKTLDYLGVPPPDTTSTIENISALPLAAYQCVYNEYYRDQNLIAPVNYKLTDGDNFTSNARAQELLTLRKRAWEHDYFTASLPFAQKGAAVDIPLGEVVIPYQKIEGVTNYATNSNVVSVDGGNYPVDLAPLALAPGLYSPDSTASVEPTTINDLRRAFRLQEWLEKNARGGTRYIESILTHFGVKSSDKRLQRPEYITGVKTPVIISEIVNTTGQTEGLPQGNMAGHGISVSSGRSGSYYCEEHGYIIGVMSVMPKTAYQQGIPRTFLKNDNLDYYWPSFAHIGEQPVTNNEIYAYTSDSQETFGYVPRYAEYKFMPSRVAGDFRTTLDYWHLGRIFDSAPALTGEFVSCDPTKRIFAVVEENQDNLYCHVLNKIKAIRPMPKFGTPMF